MSEKKGFFSRLKDGSDKNTMTTLSLELTIYSTAFRRLTIDFYEELEEVALLWQILV